jgi:nitroreductase
VPLLPLSPDELLSTTRCVRRRLDLERAVEREVLEECLRLAQQAPTASNAQRWHFVIVTEAEPRAALADLWRRGCDAYRARGSGGANERIVASVAHLYEHLHEVPVHLVPCVAGRTDRDGATSPAAQSAQWGTIGPATWSFCLAARARGLGTCWTSFHLAHEREAADLLGIPYDDVMQVALLPVAYTLGTDFRAAERRPLETMAHWERW